MSMIRWYADNSYLKENSSAETEDVLIFGGVAVDENAEHQISRIINNVKSDFRPEADFPIKWNIKDLKDHFKKQNLKDLYDELLGKKKELRRRIFKEAKDVDFKIIISVIKAYSWRKFIILKNRDKLNRYVFTNALMQLGLHVNEIKPDKTEIIMDWPEKNTHRHIFDEEYGRARFYGKSCESKDYHCGFLKELGFAESVFFTTMKECSLLQFSDLIIGATSDFICNALGKERDVFGFEVLKELSLKFLGAPSDVIDKGLIFSRGNDDLKMKVKAYIHKLYE